MAHSFWKIFFIVQNLSLALVTYSFDEFLIYFWLTLVDVWNLTEVLFPTTYVYMYSKGNKRWNTVDIRYLELSLCRTFYLVPSAFSLTSLINTFGILNSAILNFRYVEQFFRYLQSFFSCFPFAILNIRIRFSNESYCSFQAFKFK